MPSISTYLLLAFSFIVTSCASDGHSSATFEFESFCADTVIDQVRVFRSGFMVNGKQAGCALARFDDTVYKAVYIEGIKIFSDVTEKGSEQFKFSNVEDALLSVRDYYSLEGIEVFVESCE